MIAKLHLHTQRIKLIETRLSKLSSNEEIFTESAQVYQEQLQKAEQNHQLKFEKKIHLKTKEVHSAKERSYGLINHAART